MNDDEIRFGDPVEIDFLSEYELRPVEWILKPLLQVAYMLLVGRPGIGKGAVVAYWIALCTRGLLYGEPRTVLLLSSEDDPHIDLGPRIEAQGGDRSLVVLLPGTFQLPEGIETIREHVREIEARGLPPVGLVVIDPIANHTGDANSDRDSEVRPVTMPLRDLADEMRVPILAIRHLTTKEARGGLLAAILGATAWVGVPRVVLAAVRDASDRTLVHVHPIKGNRVPFSESGRLFRLEGHMLPGLPESVVRAVEVGVSTVDIETEFEGKRDADASKSDLGRELILERLRDAGGRMESDALDAFVAERTGLAERTVRNLRSDMRGKGLLRSIPEKDATGAVERWFVSLPLDAPDLSLARAGERSSRDVDYLSQIESGSGSPHHDITGPPAREVVVCPRHGRETTIATVAAGITYLACGCIATDATLSRNDIDRRPEGWARS